MRSEAIKCSLLLAATVTVLLIGCGRQQNQKQVGSPSSKDTALQPSPDAKPKIVAEKAAFNFGRVEQDTVVEHVFKVKNKGSGVLQIEKATGS